MRVVSVKPEDTVIFRQMRECLESELRNKAIHHNSHEYQVPMFRSTSEERRQLWEALVKKLQEEGYTVRKLTNYTVLISWPGIGASIHNKETASTGSPSAHTSFVQPYAPQLPYDLDLGVSSSIHDPSFVSMLLPPPPPPPPMINQNVSYQTEDAFNTTHQSSR